MENNIGLNSKAYLFLTSSPFIFSYVNNNFINHGLNKANKLEENLKKYWKNDSKILFIVSDPSDKNMNESFIDSTKIGFEILLSLFNQLNFVMEQIQIKI